MIVTKPLKLILGLMAFGLMTIGISASYAQTPVSAGAAVNQFMPIGSWNVQPTALTKIRGLAGVKLPCMMTANFDNGYVVRLSGGDQKLLAMAIDFRQKVFRQGRKYPVTIRIDGGYTQKVTATAFAENVLLFNLRKISNIYTALQSATDLRLDVDGNVMGFTIGGINHAFERLEGCYRGETYDGSPVQAMVQNAVAPVSTATWEGALPKPSRVSLATGILAPDHKAERKASRSRSTRRNSDKTMLWQASAGDGLRQTLQGWGARAGVKVDWQAGSTGTIAQDFRLSGTFEEAVQNLMAQNATAMGIEANLRGAPLGVSSSAPQRLLPSYGAGSSSAGRSATSATPASMRAGSSKWNAPVGSSLQQVLSVWAKAAGVELVWQSNQGFSVKRAVSSNGSYEAALQALLNQYTGDDVRPAVQLNNDPVTGRRILFVQSTRVL